MDVIEIMLAKLVNEKRIEWFEAKHAKIIDILLRFDRLLSSEIILIISEGKEEGMQAIQKLVSKEIVSFDGESYFLNKPLEKLHTLILKAERRKARIAVRNR